MIPPNRIRRLRHRRVVAWVFVLFALSQVALGAAIDRAWSDIRDTEYAIKKRRLDAKVAENPRRPLTLILGSSRVGHGLRAADLSDANRLTFNFSIPASGPLMLAHTWNRLRRDGVSPDRAILEVMPIFLNAATGVHQEDRMLDSARLSLDEYRVVRPGLSRPGGADRRWLFARLLPIRRHRVELRDAITPDVPSDADRPASPLDWMDEFGWQSRPVPPAERPALLGLAHRQYDSFYPRFDLDPSQYDCLRRLVLDIRATGCHTTLLTMPESTAFRRLLSPESLAAQDACVRRLADETQSPWVDAREWIADDGFYDGHHLLAEGATATTAMWRERVGPSGIASGESP